MIRPIELTIDFPIEISGGTTSTLKVWEMLSASKDGNLEKVQALAADNNSLLYCKHNYTPPIHFAVREGHVELVKFFLENGAFEHSYKTYPFKESLPVIAAERGHEEIVQMLDNYLANPDSFKFRKEWEGSIDYRRTDIQQAFENAVDTGDGETVKAILKDHPAFVKDETYFWSEGILMMPAKDANRPMVELLLQHGATVPPVTKWGQYYYFKHEAIAKLLMENGMNAKHETWHHVTLLHDMAQKGFINKAGLLIENGADINAVDEEFQSTPLGMACRWGNTDMVKFLLDNNADPVAAGANWSTPLAWAQSKRNKEIESILRKAGA